MKDIANVSSRGEGADYRALLQKNERELQAVAAILEALEAQGAVKKSNVAYDRERLEVLHQIQMAETAPRTTDAQADSMAAAQLKNYKKLYELEEEIARTKNEKVRKA